MPKISAEQLAVECARVAEAHQAEAISILDVRGICPVADFLVMCNGTSGRQRRTIRDMIKEHAHTLSEKPFGEAGYDTANWILVDFVNVVVHIFAPEYRDYYDLEMLWGDGRPVEWSMPADPAA